ncbi:nucleotidyltransferase domain-containing protein [Jiangella anatolica]|uniref:nucleotidyltransferase domain-containing protein n=1 Tax=Jiangella anatolica TaxID=2670374 RepID=UPI00131445DB|nr:nucleotidyltransferase family protein [Jiangella anatolica]
MEAGARRTADAVLAVARGETPRVGPAADDEARFVTAVRRHRVAPLAHVLLRDAGLAPAETLRADRNAAMAHHLRAVATLGALDELFDDLSWVAFKGPVLSETAHPVPGIRTYQDLDVLVDPADLRRGVDRLLDAGWRVADPPEALRYRATPGEMHVLTPSGLIIDLHWAMLNMKTERVEFSIGTRELLSRRVRVPLGLGAAWTLDPVDSLVHACLHATLTGADRMLLLVDVDALARRVDRWDDVVERAREWGAGPALAVVLSRARRVLGTPFPADVEAELLPSTAYRLVLRATDRLAPVPALTRDASLARIVARAARRTGGASMRELASRFGHGVVDRVGPERRTSGAAETATRADLDIYLDGVEAEAGRVTR